MNIIMKHILRNIRAHKGRSILMILALTVATAVLILNVTLGEEIATKYVETFRSVYGDSDVSITMKQGKDPNDLSAVELKPSKLDLGNMRIKTLLTSDIGGYAEINGKGYEALIMGIDLKDAYEMDEFARKDIDLKDNELVINERCSDKFKIHKGDKVIFTYQEKEYVMEVVEVVKNYRLTSLKFDYPYFIGNLKMVNKILGYEETSGQQMLVHVEEEEKIKEFAKYVADHNENVSAEELISSESIKDALASITSLLSIILVIVVIMIFFVVGSLNKLIISERFPVIGTFRSVGATKGRMNRILLGENIVYGVVGGLLGSILGYALNSVVAGAFISSGDVDIANEKAGVNWMIFAGGILFAILLQVVISLKAILRANRKPVKDIIFNVQSARYKINKKKSIIGFGLILLALVLQFFNTDSSFIMSLGAMAILVVGCAFLVPVWLRYIAKGIAAFSRKIGWRSGVIASKNIGYSKTIISAATLMVISITSILTVYNVSVSFHRLFESFRYNNDFDIIVENVSKEYEKYSYIKDMDGVESTEPLYYYYSNSVTYDGEKSFTVPPMFFGLVEKNLMGIEVEDSFDVDSLKDNEILVDSFYAKRNNIKVGDTYKLTVGDEELADAFTVAGTINSALFTSNRNVWLMNLETYKKHFTKVPVWIQVTLKDGVDAKQFIETLRGRIKEFNVEYMTFEEYITEQEEQTNEIMDVFYVIIGLAVALSFVGIVNNQIMGFIQRKREIAVLNSTCMSKSQIRHMLFTETLLSSAISGIIASIIAIPCVYMVNTAMEGLSMCLNIGYNILASVEFVGIVVVILLFTTLIPFRKLRKMDVVTEIKYE